MWKPPKKQKFHEKIHREMEKKLYKRYNLFSIIYEFLHSMSVIFAFYFIAFGSF